MMCPVSQGCYKKRFLGVSIVCQGCFKDVLCCMALIAAIRAEGGLVYRRISVWVFMCEHTKIGFDTELEQIPTITRTLSKQYFCLVDVCPYQEYLGCYWPNFKGRFLGPSLTDANCHRDIYQVNLCLRIFFAYKQYLSCYWPYFLDPIYLGPNLHLKFFFWTKFIFTKIIFRPKIVLDQTFFDLKELFRDFSTKFCSCHLLIFMVRIPGPGPY